MSDTVRINLRIDPKVKAQLEALAQSRGVSLNDVTNAGIALLLQAPAAALAETHDLAERILSLDIKLQTVARVLFALAPAVPSGEEDAYATRGETRWQRFLSMYYEDIEHVLKTGEMP